LAALAILQADARAVARLYEALSGEHEVVVCSSWDALDRVLGRQPFCGCLVDADHPSRDLATREIEKVRAQHPAVAIIACVQNPHGPMFFDLGGLGVAGILNVRAEPPAIRAVVDKALATSRADDIVRGLEGRFPAPGPRAIGWAVENAGPDTSVERLAAALGHTPRSLRQALEDAGLPAPTKVLLWGRLLLAGARLGSDGRTVEDVAFSLGYATATSLSRAMKGQTGLTPREVSESGGMDRVRDALFPEDRREARQSRLGRIASLVLLCALTACASMGMSNASGTDRTAIDAILEAPPLRGAHVGLLAVDASSGRVLFERNSERRFVPASGQKILLTAAAWSRLGGDYRFRTEVWAAGPLVDGTLDGDLVVIGSGDPSLSDLYWESGTAALRALADSIYAAGVRRVTGALLVDVSAWDSTTVAPTREVADLAFAYGATGGAFAIDEGELDVVVTAGPWVGAPAEVEWSPKSAPDFVVNRVRTGAAGGPGRVEAQYGPESRRVALSGTVALGAVDTTAVAQRDPVRIAGAVLARALEHAGVALEQGWEVRWTIGEAIGTTCLAGVVRTCPRARPLTALESPPVSVLSRAVLEPSQNWIAEQLLLALGERFGERGSWPDGLAALNDFLREIGVDSLDVVARDGSGLSAYDLVTPRALVRVLGHMAAHPDALAYRAAMPEPGEVDSTLEERLAGLEGRVFAKTGTISNVNSLSGYLVREGGQEVIFAILANATGSPAAGVEAAIDDIVRVLAR